MTTFGHIAQVLVTRALHFGFVPFWIAGLLESSQPTDGEKIEDSYPLSPLQHGMLFHSLRDRGSGVDIVQVISAFSEDLDVDVFERAWQRVAQRHPMLRTSFRWEGLDEPIQQVHASVPFLEQYDWQDRSGQDQEAQLQAFVRSDRRQDFDLHRAPLMRLAVFRLAPSDYRFVWTFHHALLDGWCIPIVLKEVFAVYDALRQGQEEPTLDEPLPYRDYIGWLQNLDLSRAESFWRETLRGFRASTPLVVDRLDSNGRVYDPPYGEDEIRLSESLTSALRSLARKHELTLSTLLQAAWACLLSRYSGEEDVVFGATRQCRPSAMAGAESAVGLFINTLPVRARVAPDRSLLELLKELRSKWLASREFKHTPLVDIQRWSEIPRGSHLFESILVFENSLLNSNLRAQGGQWANRTFRLISQPNTPLNVVAYGERELLIRISHDRGRFDPDSVSRMLGHLEMLLAGMSSDCDRPLARLPMLTEAERRQVLFEWNDTGRDYPAVCIHQLFEAQAERTPDADAVVFGNERVTYRELNRRANRVAHHLERLGAGPETLVAICLERSAEMVAGLLGILKAGAAYVALDPAYPAERLGFMVQDAQPAVLLTQQSVAGRFPRFEGRTVLLDRDREAIAGQSPDNPEGAVRPGNLAYVIYTSGSAGKPKGVAIEHHSTVALLVWAKELFSREELDGVLASTSICFDLSVFELFVPLVSGGKVVVAQNALELPQLPAAGEVRLVNTVPSAMTELLRMGDLPESVTTVNLAGEPLAPSLVREILRRGKVQRVFDLYGPTEDTTYSTCARRSAEGPATIGRPISNKRSYILDAQFQPVPVGVPGDLYVAGAGVARGYLNRPELTAERFLPDPFGAEGERMYRTGDRARFLPGGDIQFLGRLDNQVKLRGYRIELGEVEAVLTQHPAVRDAVAVIREDGAEQARLVAYIVGRETAPSSPELRTFLKRTLPDYMLPAAFISIGRLPLTPSGKVDRKALPPPDLAAECRSIAFEPPRTPVEEVVASIWASILGVDRIGVHDNFFELGGHSLKATQVMSRVGQAFGIELPVRTLFQAATLGELSSVIESSLIDDVEAAERSGATVDVHGLSAAATRSDSDG